jgi:DNA-binding transcriptional LysR family regulator
MAAPNLDDFAQFAAVARAGGFRAAAQARNLSASSLSEAVRRLESDLGIRLLNRTTRSVTPTEAGQRLLERLAPALEELAHAADDLVTDSGRVSGTLRLNVPGIVAWHILPPIAARFLAAHPGIHMEVTAQDELVDVLAAGFDAGIRYEERIDRDMIAVPIGPRRQRFACVAAPPISIAMVHPGTRAILPHTNGWVTASRAAGSRCGISNAAVAAIASLPMGRSSRRRCRWRSRRRSPGSA